jgi:cellulose biosynthesis protein BcsQ
MDASAAMKDVLKICCYNYKGGCGKTTIMVNAAAACAKQGKKVLQIDLDPQCNTTQFWNPDDKVGTTSETGDLAISAASSLTGLRERFSGTRLPEDQPHRVQAASEMKDFVGTTVKTPLYSMMKSYLYYGDGNTLDTVLDNSNIDKVLTACNREDMDDKDHPLWLLKGSPLLSEFEAVFSEALGPPDGTPHHRHFRKIGIFSYIINKLVAKHGFDIVFIDVSPSNSALNEVAALSCDYILPPCQASLYSCGSVYGLLTSVLPGENGWFGKHERISKKQADPNFEPDDLAGPAPLEWRLPKNQPKLLPILVTNHAREVMPAESGKPAEKQIRFAPSQFLFTMRKYVAECQYVEGAVEGGAEAEDISFKGPKVVFERNYGRAVLPFAPSVPVSIAASEAMGRPFVELKLKHFEEFFGFDPEEADTESLQAEEPAKKKRKSKQSTSGNRSSSAVSKALATKALLEVGAEGANAVFKSEVDMMNERFINLARWLIELLEKKRNANSLPLMVPA